MRHAADGGLEFSLFGISAEGGTGARGTDRYRRSYAEHTLSDGDRPRRRQQGDAARADTAFAAQDTARMARQDREERRRVVGAAGDTRHERCTSHQSAAAVIRALPASSRSLHPRGGFGFRREKKNTKTQKTPQQKNHTHKKTHDQGAGRA